MFAELSPAARGTLCMVSGGVLLTSQDAISKWLTADFSSGEIVFYRGLFMLLPIVLLAAMGRGGLGGLRPRQPAAVALRAAFTLLTTLLVVGSFARLPLADALAIVFLSPLIVTALSVPLLREPVGWRRWVAVAVGFGGVLLMTQAEGGQGSGLGGGLGWAVAIPLCAALFAALRDVTTRRIGTADAALTVLFWSTLLTVAGAAVTLAFGTHWPAPAQWGLFAVGGVLGGAAHFLMIRAFQLAEAATMAPFKYLSLVYASIYGFLLWGDVPGPAKVAGMALVAGSGLYVLHRETRLARRARVAARAEALAAED